MDNSDVIKDVISYIHDIMTERKLSQQQLANLCAEKGEKVSQRTIANMFVRPSSTTISTLLKVCDGLDLNIASVFHALEVAKTANTRSNIRFVYNIDDPAYKGYTGEYHVFFLQTAIDDEAEIPPEKALVHGTLKLGDFYSLKECSAVLTIESGDLTASGEPFIKHYEGTLIHSTNRMMFCQLVCSEFGDMWFLVFDHGNLNNKELACVVGCAATSSSGRIRHPAIHRFCLCNTQTYPDISDSTKDLIRGILRVQNRQIFITKEKLLSYLERDDLNEEFRMNVKNYLNIAKEYYALPKNVLQTDVRFSDYSKAVAELCSISDLERTYHIRHSDDRELSSILKANAKTQSISDTQ